METLDSFDIKILQELQADGRLTNTELAQRVGLSAAPCWRRVRALEQAGYIKGYHAEIARHKIGLGVLAFVRLDADRNTGERTREMEEAIRQLPAAGAASRYSRTQCASSAGDTRLTLASRPSVPSPNSAFIRVLLYTVCCGVAPPASRHNVSLPCEPVSICALPSPNWTVNTRSWSQR